MKTTAKPRRLVLAGVSVAVATALGIIGLSLPAGAADVNNCPCTLFAPTDGPAAASVDSGDGASVELGVQFRVDAAEPITGVRFYKADANVGTHIGSLWAADGTLLASATFTNETANGWQEVDFPTPVQATPGQEYVASYLAPSGHYSETDGYFGTTGVDTGILHAPGGDPATPNGLYVYTQTPAFPGNTYNAANYWVDVVASGGQPAVTLSSIAVTPASTSLLPGASTQLTATGTYSDSTTTDLTGQVAWTSSNPAVATVDSTGEETAIAAGSATITATQGSVSGTSSVTVTKPVTVTSLKITGLPTTQAKGLSEQLTATATYSDGTTKNVSSTATWSSSKPAVATVSASGMLTATGVGSTTITASFGGATATATTSVTAATVASVSVTTPTSRPHLLQPLQLKAIATYTDGTTVDVTSKSTWRSSNILLAAVSTGPVLPGLAMTMLLPGTVTISAVYNGITASTVLTVTR